MSDFVSGYVSPFGHHMKKFFLLFIDRDFLMIYNKLKILRFIGV